MQQFGEGRSEEGVGEGGGPVLGQQLQGGPQGQVWAMAGKKVQRGRHLLIFAVRKKVKKLVS